MPDRLLGKLSARRDRRMASLRSVVDLSKLPPVPRSTNWRADIPDAGVPMLGNDRAGLCVLASIAHYLQLAGSYTLDQTPVVPTEDECLDAYSAVTGYVRGDASTDNGTYVMGPAGAFEYWTRNGLTFGGELNRLTSAVTVDHRDLDHVKLALSLGPVFCGATLHEGDYDSPFMWDMSTRRGAVLGGHEVLLVGHETLASGFTVLDVMTWDGLWRCTAEWLAQAADETAIVLNDAFFDAAGVDPAGIDKAAMAAAMAQIRNA